jgi:hypothetical protein
VLHHTKVLQTKKNKALVSILLHHVYKLVSCTYIKMCPVGYYNFIARVNITFSALFVLGEKVAATIYLMFLCHSLYNCSQKLNTAPSCDTEVCPLVLLYNTGAKLCLIREMQWTKINKHGICI